MPDSKLEAFDVLAPDLAVAFNTWMQQYTEHPEEFDREWQTVTQFLREQQAGQEPSYGQTCVAMLRGLLEKAAQA